MSGAVISYAPWLAWAFVPDLATKFILDALYSTRILQRPTEKDITWQHNARTRVILISAYLLCQFAYALSEPKANAYRLLGVNQEASLEAIRKAFRRLAMMYHPDKAGSHREHLFIALRRSHDVLSDPVKRFAYDRFGISVLDWKDALSYREHMTIGLRETVSFYLLNYLVVAVISWFHKDWLPFSFWHLAFLLALISVELRLLTAPTRPWLFHTLFPRHTQRDIVLLLHQSYTSLTMAARQLIPYLSVFSDSPQQGPRTLQDAQKILQSLEKEVKRLHNTSITMCYSSDRALAADIRPLQANPQNGLATLTQTAQATAQITEQPAVGSPDSTKVDDQQRPYATIERKESALREAYVELTSRNIIATSLMARPEARQGLRKFT